MFYSLSHPSVYSMYQVPFDRHHVKELFPPLGKIWPMLHEMLTIVLKYVFSNNSGTVLLRVGKAGYSTTVSETKSEIGYKM